MSFSLSRLLPSPPQFGAQMLLVLLLTLIGFRANAQQFAPNFLGADYLRYKGILLKANPKETALSHLFYAELKASMDPYSSPVLYPEAQDAFNSIGDSLANRIFVVEDILGDDGSALTNSALLPDNAIFILKDTTSDQRIYYRYDVKFEHRFSFTTAQIRYDKKQLCGEVERSIDDFTGMITLRSPFTNGLVLNRLSIQKTVSKIGTKYYLSLHAYGNSVVVDGKGVIMLFADGSKLSKSADIEVEPDKDQYKYTAFIPVTAADLLALSTKRIKKYRLYIFDEDVSASEADKFRLFTKCVMESK